MARPKIDSMRRDEILDALEVCVIRNGVAKTTLKDVAHQANLPRPLVRYFVGNRDDMIEKLFERILERGEALLDVLLNDVADTPCVTILDFLFGAGFYDPKTSTLVGELWHLAERDSHIQKRLAELYLKVINRLADQMKLENLGKTDQERFDAAYTIVTLGYGGAAFQSINIKPINPSTHRELAEGILKSL